MNILFLLIKYFSFALLIISTGLLVVVSTTSNKIRNFTSITILLLTIIYMSIFLTGSVLVFLAPISKTMQTFDLPLNMSKINAFLSLVLLWTSFIVLFLKKNNYIDSFKEFLNFKIWCNKIKAEINSKS